MAPRHAFAFILLVTTLLAVARGAAAAASTAVDTTTVLQVGVGKSDVTGPAADVGMMAYAVINQTAKGIHTRQWARAYAFADPSTQKQFMMVVVDNAMVSQLLTSRVVEKLQAEFGGLYNADNVMLTATHTHATAAGHVEHFLYHITTWGMVWPTFYALVDGIVEACRAAHANLRPASLSWSEGELLDANLNRSPTAYLANPESERAQYTYDVDKDMTVLRIQSAAEAAGGTTKGRGMITWFPVHPVSMSNQNRLLSSDNKGVAQQWVENRWAPHQGDALEPGFTAAFAQSNTGDTTPNTLGTFCLDTGLPCDAVHSTCNGNNQLCVGRGPAWPDDTKSCEIIGQRQADKAQELWLSPGHPISGPLDYRHMYIDISNMEVDESEVTHAGHTCLGAMGYSFAAGTTDGPGAQGFYQSDTHNDGSISMWTPVAYLINGVAKGPVSKEQQACHGAKPVLLNVGENVKPYPWVPKVTEVAVLRLGNFVLVFLPGEFTTMAGRRVRNAVHRVLSAAWGADVKVVITTYTNTYSSYTTTYEEYQVQRYEGGSTLYGPHTLDAYIQTSVQLAKALVTGQSVTSSVAPAHFEHKLLSFLTPVVVDTVPPPHKFGDVIQQPHAAYKTGEVVEAVFWSANPRNNIRRGGTFLEVQYMNPSTGVWEVVYNDDDYSTKYLWDRPKGQLSSESTATVEWTIPGWTKPGLYRIKVFGDAKTLLGAMLSFEGLSREFEVLPGGLAN